MVFIVRTRVARQTAIDNFDVSQLVFHHSRVRRRAGYTSDTVTAKHPCVRTAYIKRSVHLALSELRA